jgi:hypothetical protein
MALDAISHFLRHSGLASRRRFESYIGPVVGDPFLSAPDPKK